jgi:hypothetical protein
MSAPSVRLYVDENGNYNLHEDLTNDNNRFLCLTGVVMWLSTHDTLEQKLNELKLHYFKSKEIVLHRREIISAKHPFESLKNDNTRKEFNSDLLKIISGVDFCVISILIDKKVYVDKYAYTKDPYALALEFLMQRYQYWLQDHRNRTGDFVLGDILAEARGGLEDRLTKKAYTSVYNGVGCTRLYNAQSYFSSKEIKLSKKKDNIAGLQLVDLISHPARRYILSQNDLAHNLKPTSFEQDVVEILVKEKFRCSSSGLIKGYGTVFFPK